MDAVSATTDPAGSLFDDVAAVSRTADGVFTAEVHSGWTIAGKPNGGYLLAMLGRSAAATTEHAHVIAASAHYLRSPDPGPVTIETTLLRAGRSASQVRAHLRQGDVACVEALVTVSDLEADTPPQWTGGLPAVPDVPFDDCHRLPSVAPGGFRVTIYDHVDVRLEPDSLGFGLGKPQGLGELRGWLALPGVETFDPVSLLFAVDSFPPATLDIAPSGWVPTLELTAYVRALPVPGPVQILHRVQLVAAERFDETCYVWDSAGNLVAHSTQLAGVRFA